MNTANKIEVCLELAKLAYAKHNDRRAYEWKVTLGLWAVILASIAKDISLPIYLWAVIVLIYGFFWLSPVWTANKNDKLWHDHYTKAAADLLRNEDTSMTEPPGIIKGADRYFGFLSDWAMIFQLMATIFLVLVAINYY